MVIHGDCLDVMRSMPDCSVDSIVTDPPYGIDYQSAWRTDKKTWKPKIANDKSPYIWWLRDAYRVLKEGGALLCFSRYDTEIEFRWAMKMAGFVTKAQIIWDKAIHGMGDLRGDFAPQHENIIFAVKGRFEFAGKRPKSIFRVPRVNAGKLAHPNEKPIELMRQLVAAVTPQGGTVFDPFAGSGSTGKAAVLDGYKFIGIELDGEYVKLANQRISEVAA